jgi:hypothetical protein
MKGFDPHADAIQLTPLTGPQFKQISDHPFPRPLIETGEPLVPVRQISCRTFQNTKPFDLAFLARSPAFTPATADPILDAIASEFIDEAAFATT